MSSDAIGATTRWSMVAVALVLTASAFSFIYATPFLIPALESSRATPLSQSGLLAAMPSLGMVVTLITWGYVADLVGERIVLTIGSSLTAAAAYAASTVHSLVAMGVFLFLGGMAAAAATRPAAGWSPDGSHRSSGAWR